MEVDTVGEAMCVVLCGGTSQRFGGGDKTAAAFRGTTVLDHLLDELPAGLPVLCVGDERPTPRSVTWAREDPPRGGPVAAIAAALEHVNTTLVAIVAGDMPYAARALPALRSALSGRPSVSSALAQDPDGRIQLLLGLHRTQHLRDAMPAVPDGIPVRRVLAGLSVATVPVDSLAAADIDDRDALSQLERVDEKRT